jgi:hypothetical protein
MIICALDFRHVINKYKQTKFSVVVDILLETVGHDSRPIVCGKPQFGKKMGYYHCIHELLQNLTIFSTE